MSCDHEEVIRTDKGYECGTCCQPMTVKPAAQEAGNDQHQFVESDLVDWCAFGIKTVDGGLIDESHACYESRDHPIHSQPERARAATVEEIQAQREGTRARLGWMGMTSDASGNDNVPQDDPEAEPVAPEAGNDQEVPPQPKCKNCGKFKVMHQGWRWCDIPAKPNSFFQPDDEPEPEKEQPPKVPQRYTLDHKVLSEPPVASESWEWDKLRHITMSQFAKRLIEELGAAESKSAALRELIQEVNFHGVATSYLPSGLRAALAKASA